ncbi:unnamed protein product [Amoebophrya sp. A25]|nr:unnamed protein product [Amoebophrya sp. A25]|eukprot:GSA25T00009417001.1
MPVPFQNDGHGLSVKFAGIGLGGITFEDGYYNLVSANFHTGSEHTFKGERYPLEVHLVHKRYDSEALIVAALPVMFRNAHDKTTGAADENSVEGDEQAGSALNKWIDTLAEGYRTARTATRKADVEQLKGTMGNRAVFATQLAAPPIPYSINNFVGDKSDYFRYKGSFTVPPCLETAIWFVKKTPLVVVTGDDGVAFPSKMKASGDASEVSLLRHLLLEDSAGNGNYRDVMPRQGRPITLVQAVQGDGPPKTMQEDDLPLAATDVDEEIAEDVESGSTTAGSGPIERMQRGPSERDLEIQRLRAKPTVSPFEGLKSARQAQKASQAAFDSATLIGGTAQKSLDRDVEDQDFLKRTFQAADAKAIAAGVNFNVGSSVLGSSSPGVPMPMAAVGSATP